MHGFFLLCIRSRTIALPLLFRWNSVPVTEEVLVWWTNLDLDLINTTTYPLSNPLSLRKI